MTKPRLLHIVGDSKFGGASVIIYRIAQKAKDDGFEVDVLTTDPIFQGLLREHNIGVVDLDVIWREIDLRKDIKGLLRLCSFLRSQRYDIVHTHTSKGGFVGRLAAKLAGINSIIHTVHGFPFHEYTPALARSIYVALERVAAVACDRVITVSEFHKTWALQLGIGNEIKNTAIPNGISPDRVRVTNDPEALRKELGVTPNTPMLLALGRLADAKGFEYLLEAAKKIKEIIDTPFKIVFVGSGPLETKLHNLTIELALEDEVIFSGFRDDIGTMLAASDIVVLPSLWEGLSIALLEAMAAAKPIVATTIGSTLEATNKGEGALLVAPKDTGALAHAIIEFIRFPSVRLCKSSTAKELFLKSYSEDRMLEAYGREYAQAIQLQPISDAVTPLQPILPQEVSL